MRSTKQMLPLFGAIVLLVGLFYLWVPSPAVSIARTQQRAREGGHAVPPQVVARRYSRSLANLFELYQPMADEWRVYSNADPARRYIVARGYGAGPLTVYDTQAWETILQQVGNV